MQIEVLRASKTVAIWLTSAEAEDPRVQTQLASIYADCAAKKYTPAVFRSGSRSLPEQTSGLLIHNRRQTAQREARGMQR